MDPLNKGDDGSSAKGVESCDKTSEDVASGRDYAGDASSNESAQLTTDVTAAGSVNPADTKSTEPDSASTQLSGKSTEGTVIIKNVDNTSLCNLLLYSSDDDSHTETSDFESNDDDDSQQEEAAKAAPQPKPVVVAKKTNESSLEQLPPVPDLSTLKIDLGEQDCEQMGVISSVVDRLVIIESLPNIPAYDIDTLLFLDNGKLPLGYVHDVLGPVSSPMYAVRFNSTEEIDSLNVSKGLPVYCAPKTEHTQYVFLKQLLEAKGSDASWMDDLEVPAEFADFSDDESESASKRKGGPNSNRKRNSMDKHKSFEKNMNVRNILDTRLHKIRDTCEPASKKCPKAPHSSKPPNQPCVYRFTTGSPMPTLHQVHRFYPHMAPNVFPPATSFRNVSFVPYSTPPPNMAPNFRPNVPLPPPPAVYLNSAPPPPPGVDVHLSAPSSISQSVSANGAVPNMSYYNQPPPPPLMNWYSLPPTSNSAFGGLPYYQKP